MGSYGYYDEKLGTVVPINKPQTQSNGAEEHNASCLLFICSCPVTSSDALSDEIEHDFDHECDCHDCYLEREADKDREFDERVALGYFV